jgi:type I restriction enzyme R subunit
LITPDADAKTRFILIDAVGVTEKAETISAPLDRRRTVPFDKLLEQVAAGDQREDTLSTLAARLAMLERKLDADGAAELTKFAAGRTLGDLANRLLDAIDADVMKAAVQTRHGIAATEQQIEAVQRDLKDTACRPFDSSTLRRALVAAKA